MTSPNPQTEETLAPRIAAGGTEQERVIGRALQTPQWNLPYPELPDSADVPFDIRALATRLDGLLGTLTQLGDVTVNPGGSYVLQATDAGRIVQIPAGTITVPTNGQQPFRVGSIVVVVQSGAGPVNFNAMGGVTLVSLNGYVRMAGTWAGAVLMKTSTDGWVLAGQLISEPQPPPPPPPGGFVRFGGWEKWDGSGWAGGRTGSPAYAQRWTFLYQWDALQAKGAYMPSNPDPGGYQMQIQAGTDSGGRMEGGTDSNVTTINIRINGGPDYIAWQHGEGWGPNRWSQCPVLNVNGGEFVEMCRWDSVTGWNNPLSWGCGVYFDYVPRGTRQAEGVSMEETTEPTEPGTPEPVPDPEPEPEEPVA